jgi:catechol 2,3-dioxygenase-like lactoylglutathione lyase family enzyme
VNARPRVRAVTPLLVVADLQRSLDFYCEKLGFVEPAVHGDPPCFAMLNRDGFDLMLSLADNPAQVSPHGPAGTWDLYINVADIAVEAEPLLAAGIRLDKGPTDTFYQMREIECLDPDDHRLCLAQDVSGELFGTAEVWDGELDLGAAKLRLVLKLSPSGGGLVGRLDSLDQQALNMPIDRVTLDGSSLRFEMKAIDAVYNGTLSEDGKQISGQWSQHGQTWPLVFHRS